MDVNMLIQSENNDGNSELQQVENYVEFLSIDTASFIHTTKKMKITTLAIVARIKAKHMKASTD